MKFTVTNEERERLVAKKLHNFLAECLKEPYENKPLFRRGRKRQYAKEIIELLEGEPEKITFNDKKP